MKHIQTFESFLNEAASPEAYKISRMLDTAQQIK